jgi:hypothetical protein
MAGHTHRSRQGFAGLILYIADKNRETHDQENVRTFQRQGVQRCWTPTKTSAMETRSGVSTVHSAEAQSRFSAASRPRRRSESKGGAGRILFAGEQERDIERV